MRIVRPGDPEWPDRLAHLTRPPEALYLLGDPGLLQGGGVAIVGSRRSTAYGRRVARELAVRAATAGETVLSGLAYGIDAAAHEGAVEAGAGHRCLAVVACGPEIAAPRGNAALHAALRREGAVVSEHPPGTRARPWHFPARNRILAALADEVIVVEAGDRSGALITARIGVELGREVRAVPGPIDSAASLGANRLLEDGAAPVVTVADWWRGRAQFAFRLTGVGRTRAERGEGSPVPAGSVGDTILSHLRERPDPATADEVAAVVGRPLSELLGTLLELEVLGCIERVDGGAWRAVA